MDKKELTHYISEKLERISFVEHLVTNLEIQNEVKNLYEDLLFTKTYISEISDNLKADEIPETFFYKIFHIIENIYIEDYSKIYDILNSNLSEINVSHLKEELLNIDLNANDLSATYSFYRDLGFFSENLVIVGANGSGKSTLAQTLKNTIHEKDGVVIPAQKLLIVPTFDNTPNFDSTSNEYKQYQSDYNDGKITYNASKTDDIPYNDTKKYGSEYKYVLKALFAERGYIRNLFCSKRLNKEETKDEDLFSKLDKAIEVWNSLIEHREMFCDDNNRLIIKDKDSLEEYPAYKMSDGEKNVLYLIGRVLLAFENSMIIIDEPEMYLHKAIVNKLWDKLEFERQDCIFIYLTHDLDFASSRKAIKHWIKEYMFPNSWKFEPIPENEIPENMLMKLLGSRKKVLFCEGKKNSLDVKIYELIFPNYTITPLNTCSDVINYTRSFNKISNRNTEAVGIIDRDFRTEEQLQKLENENIFSYSVAEIENLFLIEDFILSYAKYKNETVDFKIIEEKVIKLLERDKEIQASNYLSFFINYQFSTTHVKNGNSLAIVKQNLSDFLEPIDSDEIFRNRKELLDEIITNNNYSKAILIYNNKGLLGVVEDVLSLKSNMYRYKALDFLKKNDDAKRILRNVFPNKLL